MMNRIQGLMISVLLITSTAACKQIVSSGETSVEHPAAQNSATQPSLYQIPELEVTPVAETEGGYKLAASETVTFTVQAPNAREVKLLYRPVITEDRYIILKTISTPIDNQGNFRAVIRTPEDFNGEVWARAFYPDNAQKDSAHIPLTTRFASEGGAATSANPPVQTGSLLQPDESPRSDQAPGGRLEHAALQPGNGNIRLTLNVPAFLLTLWQDGRAVATYYVGVGRRAFPVPISERRATRIILNPAWIPPDSPWVRESLEGQRIPADDPRNPLGKIKIPLGNAYLIHEAAEPADIGHLVSHGCVRMLTDDIFDLTKKIARARDLPISTEEIERARRSNERKVIDLIEPLLVDINYDTQVVEGGVLHLYPDVYGRGGNTVEQLRAELQSNGLAASKLENATLRQMLKQVNSDQMFVVSLADLRAGRALEQGALKPLTPQQAQELNQPSGQK